MSLPVVDSSAPASADQRPHLLGFRPAELVAVLAAAGVDCSEAEARRVLGRLVSEGHDSLVLVVLDQRGSPTVAQVTVEHR